MSGPRSRLGSVLSHLVGPPPAKAHDSNSSSSSRVVSPHKHALTPTFFLERAAAIEPQAEAIVHITANGGILRRSYSDFAERARGLAWYFTHHGYRRIGILAPNTPAFLETIFAAGAAGGVLVPANFRLTPADIAYIFDWADVDIIVADAQFAPLLTEGAGSYAASHANVPILVDADVDATEGELSGAFDAAVMEGLRLETAGGHHHEQGPGNGWDALRAAVAAARGTAELDEDDVIAVPFTSGTTARPKGVEFTHRGAYLAALANAAEAGLNMPGADQVDTVTDISDGSSPEAKDPGRCRYLWTLPMFHAVGWTYPWAVCAVRGTHVCLRKIDYPLIWRLLREEHVTHFNAAPTVNTLLCAAAEATRLPRPVSVTVAASPPTAHLFEQMTNLNLRPVHVYGMTETYGPITRSYVLPAWNRLPTHEKFARMARQGHGFLTSLPVRVIKTATEADAAATGPASTPAGDAAAAAAAVEDVPRDGHTIGEIVFQGNICARGYYKDPEATAHLFAGGVLHSGDLAVWHPDGSIQILDRAKDIIISGGENISSVALESTLVEHPDVLEAAVVAVPDSHWGERPKVFLTIRPGAPALDPAAFLEWVKHQSGISRFMVPREVEAVIELPKTSTGKLQKNVLRQWALKGTPADVRQT